jgi:hypothetical protein
MPAIETYADPLTGVRRSRASLGFCRHGRLELRKNNVGVGLFFIGDAPDKSLSFDLLMRGHPRRVGIAPRWFIARLPGGSDYRLAERNGGGMELFRILPTVPPLPESEPVKMPHGPLFIDGDLPDPELRRAPIFISRPVR